MPKFHLLGEFTVSAEVTLLGALAASSVVFGPLHFENMVQKRCRETQIKRPPERKGWRKRTWICLAEEDNHMYKNSGRWQLASHRPIGSFPISLI